MFKERTVKKRIVNNQSSDTITLDARHKKHIQDLYKEHSKVIELSNEKKNIESDIAKLEKKIALIKDKENDKENDKDTDRSTNNESFDNGEYDALWAKLIKSRDALRSLEEKIDKLRLCEEEIEYYANTGNILFQYYDIINKQESMGYCAVTDIPKMPVVKPKKNNIPTGTKNILESLGLITLTKSDSNNTLKPYDDTKDNDIDKDNKDNIDKDKDKDNKDKPIKKGDLIDMYLSVVDPVYVRKTNVTEINVEICTSCSEQMVCMYHEGIMYCTKCGYQELLLVEQNKPVYRQPTKDSSHLSYKRINHFNEWILQCQGKESTDIPDDVFDKILLEVKKDKITDTSKITYAKMKEYLKKLKVNRFYEHIPYIISRINGIPTPHFSTELEEKLRSMFKEIQAPFLKHKPASRRNFLSYSYCIYKMLQLLEKDEYLKHFPLLKSRVKLHVQDEIWFKICEDLKWTALPSL